MRKEEEDEEKTVCPGKYGPWGHDDKQRCTHLITFCFCFTSFAAAKHQMRLFCVCVCCKGSSFSGQGSFPLVSIQNITHHRRLRWKRSPRPQICQTRSGTDLKRCRGSIREVYQSDFFAFLLLKTSPILNRLLRSHVVLVDQ